MNAKNIESKFAAMGARLKVREIASRWRHGELPKPETIWSANCGSVQR